MKTKKLMKSIIKEILLIKMTKEFLAFKLRSFNKIMPLTWINVNVIIFANKI